jgi:hypothetical protein
MLSDLDSMDQGEQHEWLNTPITRGEALRLIAEVESERLRRLEAALRAIIGGTPSRTSRAATLYELLIDRDDYEEACALVGVTPHAFD